MSGPANSTKPTSSETIGGVYNVVPPVLQDGQGCALQLDINGNLKVSGGSGGTPSLDQVTNPVTDKTFTLGANSLTFTGTSGTSGFSVTEAGSGGLIFIDTGAGGIELDSNGGIDLNTTGVQPIQFNDAGSGGVRIDSSAGTGPLALHTNATGGLTIEHAGGAVTPGVNAGPFSTVTSIKVIDGIVVTLTGTAGTTATTIASGTATLNTAAIPAVTAATVVTVAAAGVVATDSIEWAFNATPGTGYTTGLHVLVFASSGAVNFSVVNPTAGALTPAAATLNWRVAR